MDPEEGGRSGPPENYEATEPAFNVRPSSARQRNAILMAFRWRADDGSLIVVFESSGIYRSQSLVQKCMFLFSVTE